MFDMSQPISWQVIIATIGLILFMTALGIWVVKKRCKDA